MHQASGTFISSCGAILPDCRYERSKEGAAPSLQLFSHQRLLHVKAVHLSIKPSRL